MYFAIDLAYLFTKNTVYYTGYGIYSAYKYFYPSEDHDDIHQLKEDVHELKEILSKNVDDQCEQKIIYKSRDNRENDIIICAVCKTILINKNDDNLKFKDCSLIYYEGEMKPVHMYCARNL